MEVNLKQLSVRGFEPELADALRGLAEAEGISLNQAALRLMRKGAGISGQSHRDRIGNSLDEFIGTMSDGEARDLLDSIAPCDQIDHAFWE